MEKVYIIMGTFSTDELRKQDNPLAVFNDEMKAALYITDCEKSKYFSYESYYITCRYLNPDIQTIESMLHDCTFI